MPIYEYACLSCGKGFEAFILRRSDADDVACPACSAREVERRMSAPAAAPSAGGKDSGSGRPCGPVG